MTQFVQILGLTSTDVVISNTVAETTLYSQLIDGGTLDTENTLRWQIQGKIGFNGADGLTTKLKYGGTLVASCIVRSGVNNPRANNGLFIEAKLSGDGSINSQHGLIRSTVGLSITEDDSTRVGFGTAGIDSSGDQTLLITGTWNVANANNTVTLQHASLEKISFTEEVEVPSLDEPTAQILISSKLNNRSGKSLDKAIRKKIYFYAPLEHETTFYGYGDVTFARVGTTVATWRDGATHTVEENKPRFEYSGEDPLGMAINTSVETLTFDPSNALNDGNTVIWLEDGVFKSTPTNTNPFNASGVWVGTSDIHISHVVKANTVLNSSEISAIQGLIT
jgi:hypothetical protein